MTKSTSHPNPADFGVQHLHRLPRVVEEYLNFFEPALSISDDRGFQTFLRDTLELHDVKLLFTSFQELTIQCTSRIIGPRVYPGRKLSMLWTGRSYCVVYHQRLDQQRKPIGPLHERVWRWPRHHRGIHYLSRVEALIDRMQEAVTLISYPQFVNPQLARTALRRLRAGLVQLESMIGEGPDGILMPATGAEHVEPIAQPAAHPIEGVDRAWRVGGREVVVKTTSQHAVLQAIYGCFPAGCSAKELDAIVQANDSRKVLKRLSDQQEWRGVIILPQAAYCGGYRFAPDSG